MRARIGSALRFLSLVAVVVVAWLVLRGVVPAQDHAPERVADRGQAPHAGPVGDALGGVIPPERVEAFARICVAEAGFDLATGDCAAISFTLLSRAARLDIRPRTLARSYAARTFDEGRTDARRWLTDLELDAHRPEGWPRGLDWDGDYRARWLTVIGHVHALLRGFVPDPCGGHADHWGMRTGPDLERALRAGWRRLDCGPTRNAFWSTRRGAS